MELRERSERSVSLKPVQAMSFHTRIKYTTWQIEKRKNICVTKDCWHKHNRCFMFELRCLRNHDCLHVLIQHKYMSAEMMEIWKGWVWVTNVARQFELVWWLRLSLSQWQAGSSDSDWTFDSCVPIWEARLTWSGHRADSTCLKNHPSVSANRTRRQPWFDLDRPIGKQDTSTLLRFWTKKLFSDFAVYHQQHCMVLNVFALILKRNKDWLSHPRSEVAIKKVNALCSRNTGLSLGKG